MTAGTVLAAVGLAAGTWLMWRIPTPAPVHRRHVRGPGPSVIVPARDEEQVLPRLLTSLAAQHLQPLEVIVIDDSSVDATTAVAATFGARVVAAGALPPGWLGKSWACSVGAAAARSDTLVFLDADVELAPDGLARLLRAHAEDAPDGLLSVQPHHVTRRPYEQLSAICNVVSMMATGAFRPGAVADRAMAFGPCLVTSADAYSAAGGHTAVAGELIEDVHLARAFRIAGRPVRCLAGGTTVSFRMYPKDLRQLVEGWTKNLAGGPSLAPALAVLGSVAWVAAAISVALQAMAVPWSKGDVGLALAGWLAVSGQLWWILRRIGSFRWWAAAIFPVPLVAFVALFIRSWVSRTMRGQVHWRRRSIAVGGTRP